MKEIKAYCTKCGKEMLQPEGCGYITCPSSCNNHRAITINQAALIMAQEEGIIEIR